jgi:Ca-activated chloride channel family protein
MKPLCIGIRALAVLSLVAATAVAASEAEPGRTLSPYFFVQGGDPETDRLPLKATRAEVSISGVIADVVVTQVYRNEGTRPIHARYVFPASTRAAVHGMTFQVGEQRIRAQIRERQEARQAFERAATEGKSAALLEQQRPNVFGMNVANVMPQDEVVVELHYSEILLPTEGIYEFVYPAVVGPRYSNQPEAGAPESDRWVKSPYLREGESPTYAFDIRTRVAGGMPLRDLLCTSHRTEVDWEDRSTALVRLAAGEAAGGNRDYILRYRLEGEHIQSGLLLYAGPEEQFFLLLVQPPKRVTPDQIPPREYVFVLDVSGSMHGFPLDTAKTLMRELVRELRPMDRFNVLLFAGGSSLLAPESLPATPENLQTALATIDREQGGGGTELGAALRRALDLPGPPGVARSTIVITDGYVDAEAEAFDLIRGSLDRSSLFAFGIGSSVNRHLIEGMAHAGQGEPFVVTGPGDAADAATRFRAYVQSPVLTDIDVAMDGYNAYDVEPPSIPDLFAARPLVIFGKWRGDPTGHVRVRGMGGAGPYEESFDLAGVAPAEENAALRYLWARARVARLSDYGDRDGEASRRQVTDLGLRYDLLTAYTSIIAVHEVVRNPDGDAQCVDQPLPLPEGVSALAVGDALPEPDLPALVAATLLGIAVLARRRARTGAGAPAKARP